VAGQTARRWPKAALFDLDGTLVDSVPDIAEAVAALLATEGLPPFPVERVRSMIGRGVRVLVERAFAASGVPLAGEALDAMTARMLTIYPHHLVDRSMAMPGALLALAQLSMAGCRLAVVTNKPQDFCDTVLRHFAMFDYFDLVLGNQPLATGRPLPPKPAPDMLLFALDQLGFPPADAIMVGDSGSDIEAANAAQVFSVGVRGGYTESPLEHYKPRLILDTLTDLVARLPTARQA
jgi:phosphoglycolate phosphatase